MPRASTGSSPAEGATQLGPELPVRGPFGDPPADHGCPALTRAIGESVGRAARHRPATPCVVRRTPASGISREHVHVAVPDPSGACRGMAVAQPIRTPGDAHGSRYTDVQGIAEHLALTVRHVRRLVLERRIPHRKVGSLLRFDIDEVDAWMDTLRRGAAPPDKTSGSRRTATKRS